MLVETRGCRFSVLDRQWFKTRPEVPNGSLLKSLPNGSLVKINSMIFASLEKIRMVLKHKAFNKVGGLNPG